LLSCARGHSRATLILIVVSDGRRSNFARTVQGPYRTYAFAVERSNPKNICKLMDTNET
jgi:hypothetical protein